MLCRGRDGFTLAELLIVMAVAGLLAAVAVPQLRRTMSSYRLSSSAQQVAAELSAARSLALSRVTPTELTIQGRSFQVIDTEDPSNPPRAARTLEPGVNFAATPGQPVRFFSRGHARAGAYDVEDEFGIRITVTVQPSGMVQIGDMWQSGE